MKNFVMNRCSVRNRNAGKLCYLLVGLNIDYCYCILFCFGSDMTLFVKKCTDIRI